MFFPFDPKFRAFLIKIKLNKIKYFLIRLSINAAYLHLNIPCVVCLEGAIFLLGSHAADAEWLVWQTAVCLGLVEPVDVSWVWVLKWDHLMLKNLR